ncbi:MAG: hypothetical protein H6Q72_1660 [Firmicutes bacterium]|nr:hypothetical protein [Bacillota bacterium]
MTRFNNRTSKFGSYLSLVMLSAMLIFFAANIPLFSDAAGGLGFAGIWFAVATIVFMSHIIRIMPERQQSLLVMTSGHKDARTRKHAPRVRAVRG